MDRQRWCAVGGIIGPAAFIVAWSILGTRRAQYSPLHDPISRLAAVDASTRWGMTAGFIAFGAGVGAYATAARHALPGRTAGAAATTAAATVAVAALPLGGPAGDGAHAVAAAVAYASLAAVPFAASRASAAAERTGVRRASLGTAVVTGAALVASAVAPSYTGLLQRTGLTLGHLWIAATAARIVARPSAPRTPRDL
jgi:hypothetical membrane protein